MKVLFKLLAALALVGGLCSCESELPARGPGLTERLQRGVTGQGSLYIPEPDQATPFNSGR